MKKNPIKVAIIGFGRQGQEHFHALQTFLQKNQIEIVAICDVLYSSKIPNTIQYFSNYKDLFSKIKFDLAIVAVPNNLHIGICITAFKQNIHVFKEKPLALSLTNALELVKTAKKTNTLVITAQQRFYMPLFITAKKELSSLGKPLRFSYTFTLNDTKNSWYWDILQSGGGSWLNIGWHGLAIITWLLGDIKKIDMAWNIGGKRSWDYETDHTSFAKILLNSGVHGTLLCSCIYEKKELLKIICEEGTLYLSRNGLEVIRKDKKSIVKVDNTVDPYILQMENVLQMIKTKKYDYSLDIEIMKSIEAGITSAKMKENI